MRNCMSRAMNQLGKGQQRAEEKAVPVFRYEGSITYFGKHYGL